MRISGYRLKNYNHYGVDAILDCYSLNKFEGISFIIDTGANNTVINAVDMTLLNIDYQRLTPVEEGEGVISIEGDSNDLESFHFPESKLLFIDQDNKKENIEEDLTNGFAIRNAETYDQIRKELRAITSVSLDANRYPSVLGIDILRNYRLTFSPRTAILEHIDHYSLTNIQS